jgi:hypothetical protein
MQSNPSCPVVTGAVLTFPLPSRQRASRCPFSGDDLGNTDRDFSAIFDHQASSTDSVLFLGLSPPNANKGVSFSGSFHRGATRSGILFLVSIERGGSRRGYDALAACGIGPKNLVAHLEKVQARLLARTREPPS